MTHAASARQLRRGVSQYRAGRCARCVRNPVELHVRTWVCGGPSCPRVAGVDEELMADASARQRLGEKRQALVEPIIDARMVVGELLVTMCNAKLVQPSDEPTGTVE
jgi:hypothetical protein